MQAQWQGHCLRCDVPLLISFGLLLYLSVCGIFSALVDGPTIHFHLEFLGCLELSAEFPELGGCTPRWRGGYQHRCILLELSLVKQTDCVNLLTVVQDTILCADPRSLKSCNLMEDGLDGLDPAYAQITDVITLVN